jgi:hypothetical protein
MGAEVHAIECGRYFHRRERLSPDRCHRSAGEDLGRPVLTANQVALWHALCLAGAGTQVDDYGQVFTKRPVPGGIAPHIRPIPNGPGSAIARTALSFC